VAGIGGGPDADRRTPSSQPPRSRSSQRVADDRISWIASPPSHPGGRKRLAGRSAGPDHTPSARRERRGKRVRRGAAPRATGARARRRTRRRDAVASPAAPCLSHRRVWGGGGRSDAGSRETVEQGAKEEEQRRRSIPTGIALGRERRMRIALGSVGFFFLFWPDKTARRPSYVGPNFFAKGRFQSTFTCAFVLFFISVSLFPLVLFRCTPYIGIACLCNLLDKL
jgi:hypothetical protein